MQQRMPPNFEIRQEPTLADLVIERVNNGNGDIVLVEALAKDSPPSQEKVKVLIVTTALPLHNALSLFGPGVLQCAKTESQDSKMELIIQRIGITSGEILLILKGLLEEVHKFLVSFLRRNQKPRDPYRIQSLVLSNKLKPFESNQVQYHVNHLPFGLVPGYLISLESPDLNRLTKQLFDISDISPLSKHQRIQNFGRPPFQPVTKQVILSTHLSRPSDKSTTTTEVQNGPPAEKEESKTFTLVELNKREVTYLIGKNGWKIETIRSRSGAHVKVVPLNNNSPGSTIRFNDPNAKQFMRVTGTQSQVNRAIHIIEAEIQHFRVNEVVYY